MLHEAVDYNSYISESNENPHNIIAEALATPFLPINIAITPDISSSIMDPHYLVFM